MSDTIKRLEAMEALQREMLKQLQVAQDTIDRQGAEINKLRVQNAEQWTTAAKREFTLVQQKQEINELHVQSSRQWTAIAEKGTLITELESTIAEQGTTIAKQGTVIAELESTIAEQGTVIAELESTIAEQGTTIAKQCTVIAEQGVEINELRVQIASDVRQEEDLLGVAITRIRERAETYTDRGKETAEAIIRCACPSGVVFLCDLQKDSRNWIDTPNRNETLSARLQIAAHRAETIGRLPILESFARGHEQVDKNGNVFYTIHRDMFPN